MSERDKIIEKMARAYYDACPHVPRPRAPNTYADWSAIGDGERQNAINGIHAALDAAGLAVVPAEDVRREALEEAAKAVEAVGTAWIDDGQPLKSYAAEYLAAHIRYLASKETET